MEFKPYEPYNELKSKKIEIIELLNYHFSEIAISINRKITEKEKFRNPWQISLERTIHQSLYIQFYKAVRDYKIVYGRKINHKRYSSGDLKEIIITFEHFGCFIFHLSQISGILVEYSQCFQISSLSTN